MATIYMLSQTTHTPKQIQRTNPKTPLVLMQIQHIPKQIQLSQMLLTQTTMHYLLDRMLTQHIYKQTLQPIMRLVLHCMLMVLLFKPMHLIIHRILQAYMPTQHIIRQIQQQPMHQLLMVKP